MIQRSRFALAAAALALLASCGSPAFRPPATSSAGPPVAPEALAAGPGSPATTAAARRVRAPRPAYPERPPALGITTPMKGDPSGAVLAEARLVATTCESATTEEFEARVKEMRARVDASFKDWHDAQPDCWEEMREEHRARKERERRVAEAPTSSYGNLSLSTLGHGAGSGVGHGYGATSSGSHAADRVAPPSQQKASKASGTNNQVVGVDEADVVKTDGTYVYLAANGALRIAEALNPRVLSVTRLAGSTRELFVEGDRAVVYTSSGNVGRRCTYGYDCRFGGDGSTTKVYVFDVSNRAEPRLKREIELSGSLMAARRIGHAVHTVVADNDAQAPPYETWPSGMETCGTDEARVRARFAALKAENERKIRARAAPFPTMREKGKETAMCRGLLRTAIRDGQAFTTLVSFDLSDDTAAPTHATLQSRPGAVFASPSALYVSVVHQRAATGPWYSSYGEVGEVSEIHKFKISARPGDTRYVGSGAVPGHVLNAFAMDEWYGYLRVATTRGRVPDPKVSSLVSVLAESEGGNLVRVGAVKDLAPGEDIRAVRFDGDRGYVVTFKKTDPLFVLDLFQPARPAVLGELKIPGFSTYIHRIDPEHLLSIGFDANDHGSFAYFDGVILQLFDVKNPTEPKLVHKEKIGSRGSSSEAASDHLAFNWFGSEGLLAVPMTICEGGGDGKNGDHVAFSGLLVYDVDVERGFTRLGGVDHGPGKADVSCGTWWSNASSKVKRSVFLDDLVYSIAGDRAKVQRVDRLGTDVADLGLLD